MQALWACLKRDAAIEATYRAALLARFGGVLFWVVFLAALSQLLGAAAADVLHGYGGGYGAFALLGVVLGAYMQTGLVSFPTRLREAQLAGTVEATLMSPADPLAVVLAGGLWEHALTTAQAVVYIGCGALLFGLDLRGANMPGGLAVLLLAVVAFDALGLIGAALVLVARRGVALAPLLATAAALFSGVYFPVELLPAPLRAPALLLPSTHALTGLRLALLRGAAWPDLLPTLGALALFDLALVPLALISLRVALRYALRAGTLGQY